MLNFLYLRARPWHMQFTKADKAEVHREVDALEIEISLRIESLELACAGLWELLKGKHGYTDEELVDAVRTVDLKDGIEDKHINMTDLKCPHCGREQLTRNSPNCNWCGEDLKRSAL